MITFQSLAIFFKNFIYICFYIKFRALYGFPYQLEILRVEILTSVKKVKIIYQEKLEGVLVYITYVITYEQTNKDGLEFQTILS